MTTTDPTTARRAQELEVGYVGTRADLAEDDVVYTVTGALADAVAPEDVAKRAGLPLPQPAVDAPRGQQLQPSAEGER